MGRAREKEGRVYRRLHRGRSFNVEVEECPEPEEDGTVEPWKLSLIDIDEAGAPFFSQHYHYLDDLPPLSVLPVK